MQDIEQTYLDFISTVSHELRTPLTSIRGFADTLLTSREQLSDEQKEKFLHIIKDQSNRLIKLVENLLAISKMQSSNSLLIFKILDVKSVIEQTVQIVKNQYKNHNYEINIDKNAPQIYVDVDKFQQIMVNLVENAAKYSNPKTIVKIAAKSKNENLSITVTDEGIGVEAENMTKIFDKFSRIDNPLTRKTQGSGLGLFITKQLVEQMNGSISVKNNEVGCTFELLFPIFTPELHAKAKLKELL